MSKTSIEPRSGWALVQRTHVGENVHWKVLKVGSPDWGITPGDHVVINFANTIHTNEQDTLLVPDESIAAHLKTKGV